MFDYPQKLTVAELRVIFDSHQRPMSPFDVEESPRDIPKGCRTPEQWPEYTGSTLPEECGTPESWPSPRLAVQHTGWHANSWHVPHDVWYAHTWQQVPEQIASSCARDIPAREDVSAHRPATASHQENAHAASWKRKDPNWHSRRHQYPVANNEEGGNSTPNPSRTASNKA